MIALAIKRHHAFEIVAFLGFIPALGGYLASRKPQRSTLRGAIQWTLVAIIVAIILSTVGGVFLTFLGGVPQQWSVFWDVIGGALIGVPVICSFGCVSAVIMELLSRFIAWLAWLVSKQYLDDGRFE